MTKRVLLIQLARLGDLVQTIPAMMALKEAHADWILDLLCPIHLEDIGRILPVISTVVRWDGTAWNRRARLAEKEFRPEYVVEADTDIRAITQELYDCACVLNQHPRAILAGALLAQESMGAMTGRPFDPTLSPWGAYVRAVAKNRSGNRVHLADAFCGMCGVPPPKHIMPIQVSSVQLPNDLDPIGQSCGPWIGVLVGAGDPERLVPAMAWARLIAGCLEQLQGSRVLLLGSRQEQERASWILASLPSSLVGRVWDTTGRLSLAELAQALTRCQVVIGADTGPLHLAAAVGTSVIGWYFARARVHETGPYGQSHWIWQAEAVKREALHVKLEREDPRRIESLDTLRVSPVQWPIEGTIALLSNGSAASVDGWSLWTSYRDRWGAYYVQAGQEPVAPLQREQIWNELHPTAV
ncbi:glycosyltransferase family 9 protein [Nitrospira sp. BLG_1]|uniref:glycosyltransferase family 9 protein n=1 Tax=Nitrospira sp. BLG_1 TaxID=3395883 RepID=UPI0039BCCF62